jgi:phage portal protein BeeE
MTGEAVELKPDLDQVSALAPERDAQWNRVAKADFLTADEKRSMLGLPPLNAEAQAEVFAEPEHDVSDFEDVAQSEETPDA